MLRLRYDKKDVGYTYGVAVAMMVVASLVLSLVFGSEAQGWMFWLMQALYTLCIGASVFIYDAIAKIHPIKASHLNVKPRFAHLGWGILATACLIFAMMPVNSMFLDAIEAMGLKRPSVDLPSDLAGLIIVAAVLPAFCEEVVFRGAVAYSAGNMRNKLAALALSGALFALFHANPAQTLHQFVLGALLSLLALRSGSLWTSVIVHLFNNLLVVALNYTVLGTDEFWSVRTNTGAVLCIMFAGMIAFALAVLGYLKTTKSVWTTEETQEQTPASSLVALAGAAGVCLVLWVSSLFV